MSDQRSFHQISSGPAVLSWHRSDIEQRLFFRGARFTRVNTLLSLLLGILLTLGFYGLIIPFPTSWFNQKFIGQGVIPYSIALFSAWCTAILFVKWRKLKLQQRCLEIQVVPDDPSFVLSPSNVDEVLHQIMTVVDDPKQFVLFNRIFIALSNLRNMGRVSDVDEIMRNQAESDEAITESSYVLLGGFLWAIPILGFIGTVIGLSIAIGKFGAAMDPSQMIAALQEVTAGLGLAFDTTLEALVAALVIQLAITFLRKSEQEFLDSCAEYCTRQVVNKLRLLPFHDGQQD